MRKQFPDLPKYGRICTLCRKFASSLSSSRSNSVQEHPELVSSSAPMEIISNHGNDLDLIEFEEVTSEGPVINNLASPFSNQSHPETVQCDKSRREQDLEELFEGLRKKYQDLDERDPLRVRILTIAPESWSIKKTSKEFGASKRQVRKSKILRNAAGVLGETTMKAKRSLPLSTVNSVIQFYNHDDNSRIMPGRKDYKTVLVGNKRTAVQKRLLMMDMRELYASYKKINPDVKIGYSTFLKLKPKHIILPGASGTHAVCVCTKHENVKMMLDAIGIKKLTLNCETPISDYKDCLRLLTCENPSRKCHFNQCEECPDVKVFGDKINDLLEKTGATDVEYGHWTSTDRATLLKVTKKTQDFVEELCERFTELKTHSFVAKAQAAYLNYRKEHFKRDEVIVMFDYSENYKYVAQNALQAFHFNNEQCTVFPVIYFYKENGLLKSQSCVISSDSLRHDTASVFAAQSVLLNDIKKKLKFIRHVIYMTDGAKQHFKNRFQIANLRQHQADFGLSAEWHYTATAHGKSSYDGIGGAFKREAYRASLLAKPTDAILTFDKLKSWARSHFKSIVIYDFNLTYHAQMQRKLNKRFGEAPAMNGILTHHAFTWVQGNLVMKSVSEEENGRIV